eukprot:8698220-Ditylum_brightwellii.AAC.1
MILRQNVTIRTVMKGNKSTIEETVEQSAVFGNIFKNISSFLNTATVQKETTNEVIVLHSAAISQNSEDMNYNANTMLEGKSIINEEKSTTKGQQCIGIKSSVLKKHSKVDGAQRVVL